MYEQNGESFRLISTEVVVFCGTHYLQVPVSLVAARLLTQIVGNVLSDPFNLKYRKINHAKVSQQQFCSFWS